MSASKARALTFILLTMDGKRVLFVQPKQISRVQMSKVRWETPTLICISSKRSKAIWKIWGAYLPAVYHVKDRNKIQFSRVASLNWYKHCVPPSVDNFTMTTPVWFTRAVTVYWKGNTLMWEAGVQSVHAIKDCDITNRPVQVKRTISFTWRQCRSSAVL